ncbi:hypothetical protein LCGC14_2320240 [marine sediment metagenome]|uniref:Uncharacterized protein n=1 Tax=marine sediment metagenome TaxID=412755 RepID=A0A0F9CIK6_9ZZZZ
MECVICGKPVSKKARTCGPTCRSKLARSVAKPDGSVADATVDKCCKPSVADLELCRYCDKPLPELLKPRRYPGACLSCAIKQPGKASIEAIGDTVYVGSERPTEQDLIALDAAHGA